MPAFIEQVRKVIVKHRMLDAADRVLVGVSGGADSTALVLVLCELGWTPGIAHLNHRLRAEADADEAFVCRFAADLRLPFFVRRVDVQQIGHNIEAAGRAARKQFFADVKQMHGYNKIALAHNREDRIETFLLNLLRGAGPQGLTSMGPVSGDVVRPLLETTRADIEAYLRERNQSWVVDRTNSDTSYARNRLRHEVLPALASSFNVRLYETLARTIALLADEDAVMRQLTEEWMSANTTSTPEGVSAAAGALRTAAPALARRVIRACLKQAGSNLTDVTFEQIENVRHLLEPGQTGKIVELPGNLLATREFDRLVLRPKSMAESAEFSYTLQIPGSIHIPEVGWAFRATFADAPPAEKLPVSTAYVDAATLEGNRIEIRNWRPGDYYRPKGMASAKVKKLFQKARIPRSKRTSWPVLAQGDRLIWVVSFPVSRDHAAGANSEKIVAFEAHPD